MRARFLLTGLSLAILAGGCAVTETKDMRDEILPAVLTDMSDANLAALKTHLGTALGRAKIDLGAGDLTRTSIVSVLPPRPGALEGNSPALPTQFDLLIAGEACFARQDGHGELISLTGVSCQAAPGAE